MQKFSTQNGSNPTKEPKASSVKTIVIAALIAAVALILHFNSFTVVNEG